MKEIKLNVEGMSCEGCEKRIQNALSVIENVENVKASHKESEVIISLKSEIDESILKETITDLGFEVVD